VLEDPAAEPIRSTDGAAVAHLPDGGPLDHGGDHRVPGPHLGAFSAHAAGHSARFFPRVTIVHTSGEAEGQIYIPRSIRPSWSCLWLVDLVQGSERPGGRLRIASHRYDGDHLDHLLPGAHPHLALAALEARLARGMFLVFDLASSARMR